jgi:hypothetical protein
MKTYKVVFKNGTEIFVKAHSFRPEDPFFIFMKADKEYDPDICVRSSELLYIIPIESDDK